MNDKKPYPQWLEQAVFYEIYPQSFLDTNADGIGDIPGIIERLDYIKELGCSDIWLHPCFVSPFDDAGYDVEDYYTVAPRYGTNADLVRLFREAHKRHMHVLLDLVFGHTSYRHPWFQESMKPEKNEYTDRYIWTDDMWEFPEGFQCIRGISQRNGAAVVNFFSSQPALNFGFYQPDPEKKWQQPMNAPGPMANREEMKKIMKFWLDLGCDGFRVDMAASLVKNDPENKGVSQLWQDVRSFLNDRYPDAVMVSEWGDPAIALRSGFHMDFLLHCGPTHYMDLFRGATPYFSKEGKGDIRPFITKYKEYASPLRGKGFICIPSGNHDMVRIAHGLDTNELKIAFAFLLSMPGVPFIYNGDEIGMRYLENVPSHEGGFYRTGARTPMQWNSAVNAGFSAAAPDKLYLPVDASVDRPDVKSQWDDANSLLNEIKRLIRLRKYNPALGNCAEIEFLAEGYPLILKRESSDQTIVAIFNPVNETAEVLLYSEDVLYSVGGGVLKKTKESMLVSGCSAVFLEVKREKRDAEEM